MLFRYILRLMGRCLQKRNLNLQRRIGKASQNLRLCLNLRRHQIQNHNLQRTDILRQSSRLRHHENVLILQHGLCRQIILYFNRHVVVSS